MGGIGAAIGIWRDPSAPLWVLPLIVGVAIALASSPLRLGLRPGDASVELSDQGVRMPASERWAAWSQVRQLRPRAGREQIDLIDPAGTPVAFLSYRLDDFEEALRRVLDRAALDVADRDDFRAPSSMQAIQIAVVLGLIAGGVATWWLERHPIGIGLALLGVVLLALIAWRQIASVRLGPDGIVLGRGLRKQIVPWSQVADVSIATKPVGKGGLRLDVFLTRASGGREPICPPGVNPIDLERRAAAWLAKTRR